MRDKKFVIDSIKMDLHRVINASGDITKELPEDMVKTFLEHADKEFDKIEMTSGEKELRNTLKKLSKDLGNLQDSHKRLRWTDDIMTVRCRL